MSSLKDFFISYNKADSKWAEWIAWQLEEAGYHTIIQAWDFVPGSNFVGEMNRGLDQADRLIAVLSPDYLAARFTQPEWQHFFAQDPDGCERKLLTVRVRQCSKGNLLAQIVRIDLVGLGEQEARTALVEGVRPVRKKPETPVPFPAVFSGTAPAFPSNLPPIWNIPHGRNCNFTGRETLLAGMQTSLSLEDPGSVAVAISGLGGKGKTQLALEYVYRNASDYSMVWWLRAEDPTTLAIDYAALAPELGVHPSLQSDPIEAVLAVRRELAARDRWLLVFDNAEEPAAIKDYVPLGNGSIIITSRNDNWRAFAEPIAITVWAADEAAEFLIKRTGRQDRGAAQQVGEELGFLPLALEQAGAYIEATGCFFGEYLDLFRIHKQALLEKGKPATDYPDTVATTWEISFQRLLETSPLATDLMNFCAFFAPDDIPFFIFSEGAEKLPESMQAKVKDPLEFRDALAALRRYSLAEVGQDGLSMHRLVQMVMRDRMTEDTREFWTVTAVCLVHGLYSFDEHDLATWPRCLQLLPHGLSAVSYSTGHLSAEVVASGLGNIISIHLRVLGRFHEARLLSEQTLKMIEGVYGAQHANVAICLTNLGLALRDLAELGAAKAHCERALAIWKSVSAPPSADFAIALNNLGLVLHSLGEFEEARVLYARALGLSEQFHGPDHPSVLTHLSNLAAAVNELGDLQTARVCLERAVAVAKKHYGTNHPTTAQYMNNLGLALRELGQFASAQEYHEQALAIRERSFGLEHPTVAVSLNNLGLALHDTGDISAAKMLFERALAIDKKVYGPDHPQVAKTLNNLGGSFQALGDAETAAAHYEKALTISERIYGTDHPQLALCLNNLGSTLVESGDLRRAKVFFERSLAIAEKAHNRDHPNVATCLHNLGTVLQASGQLNEAKLCYERALVICTKVYGDDDPKTKILLNELKSLKLSE